MASTKEIKMDFNVKPIKRFVLLLDDQPSGYVAEDGVFVDHTFRTTNLDYYVVSVGSNENVDFGGGDRVVLSDENAGRKVRIDGVVFRVVRVSDIIAVVE